MRNVSGGTAEETRLIKAVQAAVGAQTDGSIGTQTLTDIARKLGADCWPLAVTIYSQPVIIARDALPIAAHSPLSAYANAISGSFSYASKPCSILVADGRVTSAASCHCWTNGKPESVLWRDMSGDFGISRVKTADELPGGLSWVVGGLGLLGNYDPAAEGFTGKYSDVLLKNTHTMVGCKGGYVYLVYCADMTAAQVNNFAKKLGLEKAIMLDGGHVAGINSADRKINTAQQQYYVVRGV